MVEPDSPLREPDERPILLPDRPTAAGESAVRSPVEPEPEVTDGRAAGPPDLGNALIGMYYIG